jgi:hypothetical protein
MTAGSGETVRTVRIVRIGSRKPNLGPVDRPRPSARPSATARNRPQNVRTIWLYAVDADGADGADGSPGPRDAR